MMQRIRKVTAIVAVILVSIIHFILYDHFWFSRLLGWDIYNTKKNLVFLAALFFLAITYQLIVWIKSETKRRISHVSKQLIIPLCLYFIFGIFVAIFHEQGFDAMKRYLFYLFTPVMVSLSIFVLYRDNGNIKKTLFVLFLLGIIFSTFATVLYIKAETDVAGVYLMHNPDAVDPHNMTFEYLSRHSIPGLGTGIFGPILVPLVLIGIYYINTSNKKEKLFYILATLFLYYNIIITSNRSAFVALICGLMYLCFKRFLRFNKSNFFTFSAGILMLINQKGLLLRMLLTLFQFTPSIADIDVIDKMIEKGHYGGYAIASYGEKEERVSFMLNTLQIIKDNSLVVGSGFSNYFSLQSKALPNGGATGVFLSMLAQGGLVVFIPFMLFIFLIYVNSERVLRQGLYVGSTSKDINIILTAIFLSCIVDQFFAPGLLHWHWIWFGFAAAWARNCEMEHHAAAKALRVEAAKD